MMLNVGDKVIATLDGGACLEGVVDQVIPTTINGKCRYIIESEVPAGIRNIIRIPGKKSALFMVSQKNVELVSDQEQGIDVDFDYIFA